MKLIVVSDSHGSLFNIRAVMKMHPDAGMYVHLGDGCENFVDLCCQNKLPYAAVRGNCDIFSSRPIFDMIEIGDHKLFITHGDAYGVKYSTERLIEAGRERGADVILFGHTHEPLCEYIDQDDGTKPLYLINPGSIAQPREGNPTYAVIIIRGKNILPNVTTLY